MKIDINNIKPNEEEAKTRLVKELKETIDYIRQQEEEGRLAREVDKAYELAKQCHTRQQEEGDRLAREVDKAYELAKQWNR